jgi:GTP pyrophosphokinase
MFVAMAGDLRVIFIKLVDRLHNMRTLMYHPKKEKRDRIALDTLTIFSPIADRLGLHRLHNALNEECFKVLDPENYKKLKKEMNELKPKIDIFLDTAKEEIKSLLK